MTVDELYWDPYDEDIDTDPYGVWQRMRDEQPVYRNDRYDFWALSRHEDVQRAHREPATFSSAKGTVLEMLGTDLRQTGQIIFQDPPEHTMMRNLVSRAFTPRRVAELEGPIRELCTTMLDAQVGRDSFDYLQDFGALLPSEVISTLLDIPASERDRMRHAIDAIFHIEPGVGMINDVSFIASIEVTTLLRELLEQRRNEPGEDMLSALAHAEIDDGNGPQQLSLDEASGFALLLFTAGTETVGRLLGWAATVLPQHPDQQRELATDPSLIPAAIEELLRYESPSPVQGRWTTQDVELHGTTIPAESKVLLLTGSAGRDERVYAEADRFDIHRERQGHVSFGYGVHFCIGAALARLEGRIAIEETLKRFPAWEVDFEASKRQHTSTVRGYSSIIVSPGSAPIGRT